MPSFIGGASDANITFSSLAYSILAGFTPSNYTAANTRVKAHLQGIDAQLANFNVGNKSLGTITNDDAVALHVQEYITSSVLVGSPITLTTNTSVDVTSISLTAGDWDVRATVVFSSGALTATTKILGAISGTSATPPTLASENNTAFLSLPFTVGEGQSLTIGPMRVSISTTTNIYLVAQSTFTVSTLSAYGFIGARRVR